MSDFSTFLQNLSSPVYLHVLLNPLPVYGMAAGAFILGAGFLMHWREQGAGLIWIILMGGLALLAVHYGELGYDRIHSLSTPDAQAWLKIHAERAEKAENIFMATGLLSLAAFLTKNRWPRVSHAFAWITFASCLLSVAAGGWVAHAGGRIRHSEFREGPPRGTVTP